jgi:hypothetical protein
LDKKQTSAQRQKAVEDALDVSTARLRAISESLQDEIANRPDIIERSDFLEKQLAARLDLIRAIKSPTQQLFGQLTPNQAQCLTHRPVSSRLIAVHSDRQERCTTSTVHPPYGEYPSRIQLNRTTPQHFALFPNIAETRIPSTIGLGSPVGFGINQI